MYVWWPDIGGIAVIISLASKVKHSTPFAFVDGPVKVQPRSHSFSINYREEICMCMFYVNVNVPENGEYISQPLK